jgi:hypothetical protein
MGDTSPGGIRSFRQKYAIRSGIFPGHRSPSDYDPAGISREDALLIIAERGGGARGLLTRERLGPVETAALGDLSRERVERLLDEVGFFELPARLPKDPDRQGSNPMWHSILVMDGPHEHKVEWNDNSNDPRELPEILEVLVEAGTEWRRIWT